MKCPKCDWTFTLPETSTWGICDNCDAIVEAGPSGARRVGDDLERADPPDLYERIATIIGADPDGSEHELCTAAEARMVELRHLRSLMGERRAAEEGAALDLEESTFTHTYAAPCMDCGSEILPGLSHCPHCEAGVEKEEEPEIEIDDPQGEDWQAVADLSWADEWAPTIARIEAGEPSEVEDWLEGAEPDDVIEVPASVLRALVRCSRPVEPKGSTK